MKHTYSPEQFIVPLDMNGLGGRMLRLPGPAHKDTEILFVYGQHSSLERWWGLLQYLHHFGAVTTLDLPGLGGMESFYKIGKKPTIDNFADYLASFIKMRYKRKKVIIIGLSFGFVIATRMLQRNPELVKKVSLFVSLVGFTHKSDFSFSKHRQGYYRALMTALSYRLPSVIFQHVALSRIVLRNAYRRKYSSKQSLLRRQQQLEMEAEIWLWQHNDIRTQAATTLEFLDLDNCQKQIDLPIWHVIADADQYFDNNLVEQHLRIIFRTVIIARSSFTHHAPSVVADEKEAMGLIPQQLRQIMSQL